MMYICAWNIKLTLILRHFGIQRIARSHKTQAKLNTRVLAFRREKGRARKNENKLTTKTRLLLRHKTAEI